MEDGEHDKSEQPTAFKLLRARDKGNVARSTDLGFLTGLTAFLIFALVMGPQLSQLVSQSVRSALVGGAALSDSRYAVFPAMDALISPVAGPIAFMVVVIFLVVLLFELLQTGFVFSAQPLKPDFSRLNPAKGLKRLFSVQLLIQTAKNIVKFALYAAVGYFVVRDALHSDMAAVADGHGLILLLARTAVRLLGAFVLLAFFFAVIDQFIVRRSFLKKMRMSRRELRLESREREGEPRQKQKRKQMHGEFTRAAQSLRNLRTSNVVITNPDHIAIGVKYEQRSMPAPTIVASGAGYLAQRLKRLAFVYGIPIVEDRPLARELYRRARLNGYIPEHCYRPVADIFNAIQRRGDGVAAPEPERQCHLEGATNA